MKTRISYLSWDDFGSPSEYLSLSRFECLVIVAQKAYENEFLSSYSVNLPMHGKHVSSKRKLETLNPNPKTPVLPQEFKDFVSAMGGTDPKLVIQKNLFSCDVGKNHGRITMPVSECGSNLGLTKEEKRLLEIRDRKEHLVGMKVKVIDPNLKVKELCFKKWCYENKSAVFVLVSGWNEVVASNNLVKGDVVQVWVFRVDGQLRFAVVKLPTVGDIKWGVKRRRT